MVWGAPAARKGSPAALAATSAAGTDKCEAGWVHAGRSCYRRFPDQVAAAELLNIFLTLTWPR